MAWADLKPEFRALVESVCTPAELEVMRRLDEHHGQKKVARALGVSRSTVQTLRKRAERKISCEIARRAAVG